MPRYALPEVLRDLHENVAVPHEVIVVCNGQDKELVEFVSSHPHIDKYCLNSVNVGVARSWNMGAEMAEGDVFCYLNDDVAVGKGAIEQLFGLFDDPMVGEVGPHGGYWKDCKPDSYVQSNHPVEADVIYGFCFLVKASTFRKVGGFDVEFSPAGYEEIDFSFRVRESGLKCIVDSRVEVKHYHHHGVSAYKTDISYLGKTIDTLSLHEKNTAYFREKWQGKLPSVTERIG